VSPLKLPERLPRETGRDYALRVLKENIVNLEIAPGSQISENELSAALGISRAPIREALSELEKVKIVEIQPQKKTSVLLIDPALVEEARFMRSTLEDAVIGEVCMQRTEQDLFRLEENLTLQDLAFRSNALDQVMIKDNEFHRYFFEISRKPEIYQLMQTLQIHFDRVRNLTLYTIIDRKILEEHKAIFRCIRERDAANARIRLRTHLERVQVDSSVVRKAYPQYFKQ
jgi:DNA-binding GntR family transcriptional regulator